MFANDGRIALEVFRKRRPIAVVVPLRCVATPRLSAAWFGVICL